MHLTYIYITGIHWWEFIAKFLCYLLLSSLWNKSRYGNNGIGPLCMSPCVLPSRQKETRPSAPDMHSLGLRYFKSKYRSYSSLLLAQIIIHVLIMYLAAMTSMQNSMIWWSYHQNWLANQSCQSWCPEASIKRANTPLQPQGFHFIPGQSFDFCIYCRLESHTQCGIAVWSLQPCNLIVTKYGFSHSNIYRQYQIQLTLKSWIYKLIHKQPRSQSSLLPAVHARETLTLFGLVCHSVKGAPSNLIRVFPRPP